MAGSVFGAIALVISIAAFWEPRKVKLSVEMSTGFMLSQVTGQEKIDVYIITVKNIGIRAVSITNVYLHFGGKSRGNIFIGLLNQNSPLQYYTPKFPVRMEQGESFSYYLVKQKLNTALDHFEEKTSLHSPLKIRVDEVTQGTKYYKTNLKLGDFIENKRL